MAESSSYLTTTANAYDAVAELYADLARDSLDRLPLDRSFVAVFAELVRAAGPRPVVEAGCGPGYMTAHLRDLGLDAYGVDLSPALLDIARKDHPGLRFELGSMGELDVPDGELGGLLSWYSIIHTPPAELPPYFAEFRRVLAPGGYLLLGFFESEGDPVTEFDHKVAPAYRWPIDELADLGRKEGFVEVGRMLREPLEDERLRRGHLLMRRP
ncbi:class I SAM-dependent DNA methyltransferase [Nonomuraea gerenzanensis]|uniref:Putative methyltransferase n=1 Tax=Nonomuraea gerenzanensis TaxID=93944 RepID=A0A1M4DXZ9_9ACTN|nr:class I SAM-dependent methyltransferase [Nonomuraea gerenzanensis]UBU13778.1 methyltransferase domain-containing protein [Nonomuraea gerenzanensis]SBO91449.1 putative methyltransferase [Nonomuraea gerenzanensis]